MSGCANNTQIDGTGKEEETQGKDEKPVLYLINGLRCHGDLGLQEVAQRMVKDLEQQGIKDVEIIHSGHETHQYNSALQAKFNIDNLEKNFRDNNFFAKKPDGSHR